MLTIAFFALVAASDAFPFPSQVPAEKPPSQRPPATFSGGVLFEAPTDLGAARLGVTRGDIGIRAPIPPLGEWRVVADLASEWSWYDFDDFGAATGGHAAPMSRGHSSLIGLTLVRPFAEVWTFVARPVLAASADEDADFGDSLLFGGFLTIGRKLGDDFTVSAGFYAAEQFEEDAVVFPIVGVEWQIDPATKLTSPGPGLRLTRDLSPEWQAYAQGIYRPRDYRLADDSSVPGGALSDDAFPVSLGALWTPMPGVQFSAQIGALVGRNVEVRDDDGNVVFDESADTSVFAGVGFRIGI